MKPFKPSSRRYFETCLSYLLKLLEKVICQNLLFISLYSSESKEDFEANFINFRSTELMRLCDLNCSFLFWQVNSYRRT